MIDAIPSASESRSSAVELAELLGVLSLANDLGMGQPMEHMLRQLLVYRVVAQSASRSPDSSRSLLPFANRCLYTAIAEGVDVQAREHVPPTP